MNLFPPSIPTLELLTVPSASLWANERLFNHSSVILQHCILAQGHHLINYKITQLPIICPYDPILLGPQLRLSSGLFPGSHLEVSAAIANFIVS